MLGTRVYPGIPFTSQTKVPSSQTKTNPCQAKDRSGLRLAGRGDGRAGRASGRAGGLFSQVNVWFVRGWYPLSLPGTVRSNRHVGPYEVIGCGAVDVTKPYTVIWFDGTHGPKHYEVMARLSELVDSIQNRSGSCCSGVWAQCRVCLPSLALV